MPELKTYDLFISHAWKHHDDYDHLEEMLKNAPLFKWRNYSATEQHPVVDDNDVESKKVILEHLERQIKPVNLVMILGGMYVTHSKWINEEIRIAQHYKKPIIGIYPRGHQNMPLVIQEAAVELVGWNTGSIVAAIRQHAL